MCPSKYKIAVKFWWSLGNSSLHDTVFRTSWNLPVSPEPFPILPGTFPGAGWTAFKTFYLIQHVNLIRRTGTCLEVFINSPEIHFFCRKYSVYISQHYILLYTIIPQQQTARLGLSQFVGFRAPFWFVYAIFQWPNFHSHSMTIFSMLISPCVAQVNVSWPDWEGHLRLILEVWSIQHA